MTPTHPWYGERLDLDHAIYVCLANARNQHERQEQPDQPDQPDEPEPFRPRAWVVNPFDWIRQRRDEHAAA